MDAIARAVAFAGPLAGPAGLAGKANAEILAELEQLLVGTTAGNSVVFKALASAETERGILSFCAHLLRRIVSSNLSAASSAAAAGVIPRLAHMLADPSFPMKARAESCWALANIASCEDTRLAQAVLASGAVDTAAALLSVGTPHCCDEDALACTAESLTLQSIFCESSSPGCTEARARRLESREAAISNGAAATSAPASTSTAASSLPLSAGYVHGSSAPALLPIALPPLDAMSPCSHGGGHGHSDGHDDRDTDTSASGAHSHGPTCSCAAKGFSFSKPGDFIGPAVDSRAASTDALTAALWTLRQGAAFLTEAIKSVKSGVASAKGSKGAKGVKTKPAAKASGLAGDVLVSAAERARKALADLDHMDGLAAHQSAPSAKGSKARAKELANGVGQGVGPSRRLDHGIDGHRGPSQTQAPFACVGTEWASPFQAPGDVLLVGQHSFLGSRALPPSVASHMHSTGRATSHSLFFPAPPHSMPTLSLPRTLHACGEGHIQSGLGTLLGNAVELLDECLWLVGNTSGDAACRRFLWHSPHLVTGLMRLLFQLRPYGHLRTQLLMRVRLNERNKMQSQAKQAVIAGRATMPTGSSYACIMDAVSGSGVGKSHASAVRSSRSSARILSPSQAEPLLLAAAIEAIRSCDCRCHAPLWSPSLRVQPQLGVQSISSETADKGHGTAAAPAGAADAAWVEEIEDEWDDLMRALTTRGGRILTSALMISNEGTGAHGDGHDDDHAADDGDSDDADSLVSELAPESGSPYVKHADAVPAILPCSSCRCEAVCAPFGGIAALLLMLTFRPLPLRHGYVPSSAFTAAAAAEWHDMTPKHMEELMQRHITSTTDVSYSRAGDLSTAAAGTAGVPVESAGTVLRSRFAPAGRVDGNASLQRLATGRRDHVGALAAVTVWASANVVRPYDGPAPAFTALVQVPPPAAGGAAAGKAEAASVDGSSDGASAAAAVAADLEAASSGSSCLHVGACDGSRARALASEAASHLPAGTAVRRLVAEGHISIPVPIPMPLNRFGTAVPVGTASRDASSASASAGAGAGGGSGSEASHRLADVIAGCACASCRSTATTKDAATESEAACGSAPLTPAASGPKIHYHDDHVNSSADPPQVPFGAALPLVLGCLPHILSVDDAAATDAAWAAAYCSGGTAGRVSGPQPVQGLRALFAATVPVAARHPIFRCMAQLTGIDLRLRIDAVRSAVVDAQRALLSSASESKWKQQRKHAGHCDHHDASVATTGMTASKSTGSSMTSGDGDSTHLSGHCCEGLGGRSRSHASEHEAGPNLNGSTGRYRLGWPLSVPCSASCPSPVIHIPFFAAVVGKLAQLAMRIDFLQAQSAAASVYVSVSQTSGTTVARGEPPEGASAGAVSASTVGSNSSSSSSSHVFTRPMLRRSFSHLLKRAQDLAAPLLNVALNAVSCGDDPQDPIRTHALASFGLADVLLAHWSRTPRNAIRSDAVFLTLSNVATSPSPTAMRGFAWCAGAAARLCRTWTRAWACDAAPRVSLEAFVSCAHLINNAAHYVAAHPVPVDLEVRDTGAGFVAEVGCDDFDLRAEAEAVADADADGDSDRDIDADAHADGDTNTDAGLPPKSGEVAETQAGIVRLLCAFLLGSARDIAQWSDEMLSRDSLKLLREQQKPLPTSGSGNTDTAAPSRVSSTGTDEPPAPSRASASADVAASRKSGNQEFAKWQQSISQQEAVRPPVAAFMLAGLGHPGLLSQVPHVHAPQRDCAGTGAGARSGAGAGSAPVAKDADAGAGAGAGSHSLLQPLPAWAAAPACVNEAGVYQVLRDAVGALVHVGPGLMVHILAHARRGVEMGLKRARLRAARLKMRSALALSSSASSSLPLSSGPGSALPLRFSESSEVPAAADCGSRSVSAAPKICTGAEAAPAPPLPRVAEATHSFLQLLSRAYSRWSVETRMSAGLLPVGVGETEPSAPHRDQTAYARTMQLTDFMDWVAEEAEAASAVDARAEADVEEGEAAGDSDDDSRLRLDAGPLSSRRDGHGTRHRSTGGQQGQRTRSRVFHVAGCSCCLPRLGHVNVTAGAATSAGTGAAGTEASAHSETCRGKGTASSTVSVTASRPASRSASAPDSSSDTSSGIRSACGSGSSTGSTATVMTGALRSDSELAAVSRSCSGASAGSAVSLCTAGTGCVVTVPGGCALKSAIDHKSSS